jgi:hypothetical protein
MRKGLLLAALLVAASVPASVPSQGLGDAARKEQKRRSEAKPGTTKSYSQDDLGQLPPIANAQSSGEPSPPTTTSAGSQPGDPATPTDDSYSREERQRRQDEARWRDRVAKARKRLEDAEEAHAALASLSFGSEDSEVFDAHGQVLNRSLGDLQQATARAKAERDAAQRALEDLLEEARRAGVPPGWLR